jgi:hypothetical protein
LRQGGVDEASAQQGGGGEQDVTHVNSFDPLSVARL